MKNIPSPLFQTFDPLFQEAIAANVFPGAAVGVCLNHGGCEKTFSSVWGKSSLLSDSPQITRQTLFDLASLTKPLATTLAILSLEQAGNINLEDTLPTLLENEEIGADKNNITLRHLLNHCSGFAAHQPYYKKLIHIDPQKRKKWLLDAILREQLDYQPATESVYSDLGFILLGLIIERKSGLSLDDYVRLAVMEPVGLGDRIIFNPLAKKKTNFAATERCPWRNRVLSGEVHDDNTFVVGGVSGQAGLFGDIDSVLQLITLLLDVLANKTKHPSFSAERLRYYCQRQDMVKGSSWALGFDTPSIEESSAGNYISSNSAGHLGFTGTSFWIDRDRRVAVVLLTNRVHPSRENNQIKQFRPRFHDAFFSSLF
ncbi:MAG: serine hydrolase [Pseudomonadota bacterium]